MVLTRSGRDTTVAPVVATPVAPVAQQESVANVATAAPVAQGVAAIGNSIQTPKAPKTSVKEKLVGIKNAIVNFFSSIAGKIKGLFVKAKNSVVSLFQKKPVQTPVVQQQAPAQPSPVAAPVQSEPAEANIADVDGKKPVTTAGGMELRPRSPVSYSTQL